MKKESMQESMRQSEISDKTWFSDSISEKYFSSQYLYILKCVHTVDTTIDLCWCQKDLFWFGILS